MLGREDGKVIRRPLSAAQLLIGVTYEYTIPICESLSPIDLDGSFWDLAPADYALVEGRKGTFVLMQATQAAFRTADGATAVVLVRHVGNKTFADC